MNILFIHINSRTPRYLVENIKRCREIFPEHQIHLMHSLDKTNPIKGIKSIQIDLDDDLAAVEELIQHPMDFRNKFWFSSIARLLLIEKFMQDHSGDVLHVESDVLLARDFPFENIRLNREPIAYPVVFEKRAVASTVYVRDLESATLLANFTRKKIVEDGDTTDMLVLRQFFDAHPEKVCPLPFFVESGPTFIREIDRQLRQKLAISEIRDIGLFDGSDFGVYYFGTDPRNSRGKMFLRKDVQLTNLELRNWELKFDDKREFPTAIFDKSQAPIFSLHLTCKDSRLFNSRTSGRYIRKRIGEQHSGEAQEFRPIILLKQIGISLRKRMRFLIK